MKFVCLILLVFPLAHAELLLVEQSFGGIECASCAGSIVSRLQRMRGVREVKAQGGTVRVALETGNRIKLAAIRDTVKSTGYTPGDAAVTATGNLEENAGKWRFTIDDQAFEIEQPMPDIKAGPAEVEGVVPAAGAGEPLRLRLRRLQARRPDGGALP
jgi:hypothetical protein